MIYDRYYIIYTLQFFEYRCEPEENDGIHGRNYKADFYSNSVSYCRFID